MNGISGSVYSIHDRLKAAKSGHLVITGIHSIGAMKQAAGGYQILLDPSLSAAGASEA